jgi:hypothetical protein
MKTYKIYLQLDAIEDVMVAQFTTEREAISMWKKLSDLATDLNYYVK